MPSHANIPPPIPAPQRAPKPYQHVDFNACIKRVRKIYDKYSSGSGGKEYANASHTIREIEAIIHKIRDQVPHVSFAGKQDAMNAIVDIAVEMLESTRSTLAHEIRKSYYWHTLGDAIERIIDRLSPEEIAILQEDGTLANELCQLKESADDDLCLDGAIDKLSGASDEEDEEDDGDDEGDEHHSAQEDDAVGPSNPPMVLQSASAIEQTAMPPQQYANMPLPAPVQQHTVMPTQTIDFTSYPDEVRRVYDKYSSGSSTKELDNKYDAISEIEGIVKTIMKLASGANSAGKQDAMSAIVEIGLKLLEEGSTLSYEIRHCYDWDTISYAVEGILDSLSREEISVLQTHGQSLEESMEQLDERAKSYVLGLGLDWAIRILGGWNGRGPDEEDDEEDGAQGDEAAGRSQTQVASHGVRAVEQAGAATPCVEVDLSASR
jgi:hypothetical protein